MNQSFNTTQLQALEACLNDVLTFFDLIKKLTIHRWSALLIHSFVPSISMFVIESHKCLSALYPSFTKTPGVNNIELLRKSRHRAKLLDSSQKSLEDLTKEILQIAQQQQNYFLGLHSDFMSPLQKWIQPDMGLSTFGGHIFSTTHSTIFGFGGNYNIEQISKHAREFGEVVDEYLSALLGFFKINSMQPVSGVSFSKEIELRDIKYQSLYAKGTLGGLQPHFAAGLALLMSNLNFARYILNELLPLGGHSLFRLKFIIAYHVNSNLKAIQSNIHGTPVFNQQISNLFQEALGNSESRWLRKQRDLRNLLVHYLPDSKNKLSTNLPPGSKRIDAIEILGASLAFNEMDDLLSSYIINVSNLLEEGFELAESSFWYGKVKI